MFLDGLLAGLLEISNWTTTLALVVGVAIGMLLGAIPGISATLGVALAIPFSYGMEPITALALIAGIHCGGSQGGAIPAILLRIPGTSGGITTAWDGYPMATKGHASAAIRLSAMSSAVGGFLGALALLLLSPALASFAVRLGPSEVFWVIMFGLTAVIALVGQDIAKGVASVCLGLLISLVGIDTVTGQERYTFGMFQLSSGIPALLVMVGVFSLPPTLALSNRTSFGDIRGLSKLSVGLEKVWTVAQVWKVWVRSSLIGLIIGLIPGSSAGSVFIAYADAKRVSKHPEMFGKGSPEGLAAAEATNNADNAGAMIPALTLGIPGGTIAALVLGALLVQGLTPGPTLYRDHPEIVFGYGWLMIFGALLLIPLGGLAASRIFVQALRVPPPLMFGFIAALMVVGTFSFQNNMFDVYMMLFFGVVGLFLERVGLPTVPFVIAVILGGAAEYNMRIALLLARGDVTQLFMRPASLTIIIVIVAMVGLVIAARRRERRAAAAGKTT